MNLWRILERLAVSSVATARPRRDGRWAAGLSRTLLSSTSNYLFAVFAAKPYADSAARSNMENGFVMTAPFNTLSDTKLTKEQETILAQRIKKGPNRKSALESLVLNNLKEASIYAKHYCPKDLFSDGELMSLCYDVLTKSAPRFRPSFGIRFVAFCKPRLRGAVKRHCTTLDVVKHASVKRTDDSSGATFTPFTGGADLPTEAGEQYSEANTCTQGGTTDFDFAGVDMRELWQPLKHIIREKLNPRQRMVLRLVYDLGFNMQEIGDMLAVSRSAVQMTHSSALEILRRELGPKP